MIQNSNSKPFLKADFQNCLLVIDYQSLGCWKQMCFEAKAWSTNEIVWGLIFFLILFAWPWINLEAMLSLWMFVEATLFDSTLASLKLYIQIFTLLRIIYPSIIPSFIHQSQWIFTKIILRLSLIIRQWINLCLLRKLINLVISINFVYNYNTFLIYP